jgi:hypothetical protein
MTTLLIATFALLLGSAAPEPVQGLRYWGRLPDDTARGRIQYDGRYYDVRAGDEIPGWGRVRAVTARALVVRRTLTEAEKEAREAQGLLATGVQDLRIPLAAGNLASAPAPAPPER